jgi:hypothetical protein
MLEMCGGKWTTVVSVLSNFVSLSLTLCRNKRHYDNTYKDFTYYDFTYNINKCDITYVHLFTVITKVIYK